MNKRLFTGIALCVLAFTAFDASAGAAAASERVTVAQAETGPAPQPQNRGPRAGAWRGPASFADFDLNGDGQLTEQEFNEGRAKRMTERAGQGGQMRNAANAPSFAEIDANGDGIVTPEEFTDHQSKRRSGR